MNKKIFLFLVTLIIVGTFSVNATSLKLYQKNLGTSWINTKNEAGTIPYISDKKVTNPLICEIYPNLDKKDLPTRNIYTKKDKSIKKSTIEQKINNQWAVCYQVENGENYVQIGDNSTVFVFQEEKIYQFNTDYSQVNISISCDGIPQNDLWINEYPERIKFGVIGNFTGIKTCSFEINSNTILVKENNGWYLKENDNYYNFDFSDVITKDLSNYSELPDAYFEDNKLIFKTDNNIDPTITVTSANVFDNGVQKTNVTFESTQFSHLTLVGDTSNPWRGFNYTTRTPFYPYFEDDNNSYLFSTAVTGSNVRVPYNISFNSQNLTVAMWVYSVASSSSGVLLSRMSGGGNSRGYSIDFNSGFLHGMITNGTTQNNIQSASAFTLNSWHHVILTVNDTNMTLYVDGLINKIDIRTIMPIVFDTNDLSIGALFSGFAHFNGSIDNVLLLNRSLSSTEAFNLFSLGRKDTTYIDPSLVSAWRFDDTFHNKATDSIGFNNGTFNGQTKYGYDSLGLMIYYPFSVNTATSGFTFDYSNNNFDGTLSGSPTFNQSCLFGNCYSFGTTSNVITNSLNNLINSEFTMCVWAKANRLSSSNTIISTSGTSNDYTDIRFNGDTIVTFELANGTTATGCSANSIMPSGFWQNWNFYCLTGNSSNYASFYYNGYLNGSKACGQKNDRGTINIGRLGTGFYYFNGSIDEVMVFNKALNNSEILDIYNNQSNRFNNTGSQSVKQTNVTSGYSKIALNTDGYARFPGTNISMRIGRWDVSQGYNNSDINSTANGLISYYHFDEESWSGVSGEVKDAMGINNGTSINATGYANTTNMGNFPYYRVGDFDGITKGVNLSKKTDYNFANSFAVSLWFNRKGSSIGSQTSQIMISNYMGTGGNDYWMISMNTTNKVRFGFRDSAGNNNVVGSSSNVNTGWHHVVGVRDSSTQKAYIYVDGILEASINDTTIDDIASAKELWVGLSQDPTNAGHFNGSIDEVMIFNRSITDLEIDELYTRGRANWNYSSYQNLTEINSTNPSSQNIFNVSTFTTNILTDFIFSANQFNFMSPALRTSLNLNYVVTNDSVFNLNITYPLNITYGINISSLNFTVNDILNGDSCWYSNGTYNSTNLLIFGLGTYFNYTFLNINTVEGINNFTIYCNDSLNAINSINVSFNKEYLNSSITTCPRDLSIENYSYNLLNNINSPQTCINIKANNISLNMNGYYINSTSSGGTTYGIYTTANLTTIYNGSINNFYYGIYGITSNLGNFTNLSIFYNTPNNFITHYGIYLLKDNNTIYSNQINYTNIGTFSVIYGININSNNNLIYNNNILINSITSRGINLVSSNNNTIINNNISFVNYSIYLTSSHDNDFFNNSILNCTASNFGCIYLTASQRNLFQGGIFNSSNNNMINLIQSNNTLFQDITILNSMKNDTNLTGYSVNTTFLNVSYNNSLGKELVGSGSQLIRRWYYQAYVNDSSNKGISNINISSFMKNGSYSFNISTNSSGWTNITTIIDYSNDGSLIGVNFTYYSNYTIYGSILGFSSNNHFFNSTLLNNSIDYFSLIDSINPNISLLYPINNSFNNSNINLTVNGTDNNGIKNISITIGNSTWSNSTTINFIAGTINTIVGFVNTLSDGIYNWFAKIFDWDSNNYISNNYTLTIDNLKPFINLTIMNNTNYSNPNLNINYTFYDLNGISSCWYSNDTYSVNTTIPNCDNLTTLTWREGQHNLTIWINDTTGNINYSSIRFTIDTTPPLLYIQSPSNITYRDLHNFNYSLIFYNKSVDNLSVSAYWYSLNGGANVFFTPNTTINGLLVGSNILNISVNDSLNNINSQVITFYLGFTPTVSNINISNSTTSYTYDLNTSQVFYLNFDNITDSTIKDLALGNNATRNNAMSFQFDGTFFNNTPNCGGKPIINYTTGISGSGLSIYSETSDYNACMYTDYLNNSNLSGFNIYVYAKGFVRGGMWNDSAPNGYDQAYWTQVDTNCKTPVGNSIVNSYCNNNQIYNDWTLFSITNNKSDSKNFNRLYLGNNVSQGINQAGYYDLWTTGATWYKGRIGYGMIFDGFDDYLSVPNSPSLNPNGWNYTLATWIKTSAENGTIYYKYATTGADYIKLAVSNGKAYFSWDNGDGLFQVTSPNYVNDSQWHFIVAERIFNHNATIHVDDVYINSTYNALGLSSADTDSPVYIGQNGSNAEYYKGMIDELRVWNKTLTQLEMKKLYSVTNPVFEEYSNASINVTLNDIDTNQNNLWYEWFVDGLSVLKGFTQNVLNYIFNKPSQIVQLNVNDSNNFIFNQTWNISTNLINPDINYNSTVKNYENLTRNYFNLSINWTEPNLANITFYLKDSLGNLRSITFSYPVYTYTWSGLSSGNYSYWVNITDLSNNKNSTNIYYVNITYYESPSGGGSEGGGSSLTFNIDTYICKKMYPFALNSSLDLDILTLDLNNYVNVQNVNQETMKNYWKYAIDNFDKTCSEKINRTSNPYFLCNKAYYFILSKDTNVTNLKISMNTTLSERIIAIYLNNYNQLCLGYSPNLPLKYEVIDINNTTNETCSNEVRGVISWTIPTPSFYIGEVNCANLGLLKYFFELEYTHSYSIVGIRIWWIILISIILIYINIKGVRWYMRRFRENKN